jgi:hypothetical protein
VTRKATKVQIYTVVEAWRGIASAVKNFRALDDAERHLRRVRCRHNLAEDDVQLFRTPLHSRSK